MGKKAKWLCAALVAVLLCAQVCVAHAVPLGEHEQTEPTGTSQLDGIAITQKDTAGGGVMLEQIALSTTDLTDATCLAVQYYNPTGAAWPFYVQVQYDNAVHPAADNGTYSVWDTTFTAKEDKTVQYGTVAPTEASGGWIVIPASAFGTFTTVQAVYITLPAAAAEQIDVTTLHFGKVVYSKAEAPNKAGDFITLTDFGTWTEAWFAGRETNSGASMLSIVKSAGETVDGKINGVAVTQTAYPEGGVNGGLMVNAFAGGGTLDITDVAYIGIEYANAQSVDMAAVIILQDSENVQKSVAAGSEIRFVSHEFSRVRTATSDGYVRPRADESGYMILPKSAFEGIGNTIVAVYLLLPVYTADLNGYGIQYGRIATYSQKEITDFAAGEVIADPFAWLQSDYDVRNTAPTSVSIRRCKAVPEVPVACDLGDVRILEDMDTGYAADEAAYNAGMADKVYKTVGGLTVKRTEISHTGYGVELTVTEPVKGAPDPYAGFTFTAKPQVNKWEQWRNDDGGIEGVTFFVSNRSDAPISIGFEIDEFDPEQDVAVHPSGERWSIGLGGRILYYDTVTGKSFLHNATPTLNIPVGFTGWVRIPVSCFEKPSWCTWGNSVLDLTRVPQFTFSVHTGLNGGACFVLDSVGLYYNKTTVDSLFAPQKNTIADNMGLKEENA